MIGQSDRTVAHFLFLARPTPGHLLPREAIDGIAQDLSTEWRTPVQIERNWEDRETEQLLLFNAHCGVLVENDCLVLGTTRPPGPGAAAIAARDPEEPRSVVIERHATKVEIRVPICAARRVWWAIAPDGLVIVTTVQRLALACLGDFQVNDLAAGWVLGTGALGPDRGWDERLTWLAPGSRLTIDRQDWKGSLTALPPLRLPERQDEDPEAGPQLRAALEAAALRVPPQSGQFLTLSGGIDCRVLTALLVHSFPDYDVPAITWGCGPAPRDPNEDSHIAARVAREFDLDHRYFQIDAQIESISFADFFSRFVRVGEGLIDHTSGYFDNFRLFDSLVDMRLSANLRADEVFGGPQTVYSEFHVRALHSFLTLDDFANCRSEPFRDIPRTELGSYIVREPGESLENLRDRLYLLYRVPVAMAGLAELKSAFVEVVNPFLADSIVQICRGFSPDQRTGKHLFQTMMVDLLPKLPIANKGSNPDDTLCWSMRGASAFAAERFHAPETSALLPEALFHHLSRICEATPRAAPPSWRERLRWLRPYLPDRLLRTAKRGQSELRLANHALLMRALIVCEAEALMKAWAAKRLLG